MGTKLSATEQIMHSIVRIVGHCDNGMLSVGTGFFMVLPSGREALISNRHIFQDVHTIQLTFTLMGPDGNPLLGHKITVDIPDIQKNLVQHPSGLDLAFIPFSHIGPYVDLQRVNIFRVVLDQRIIPNKEQINRLSAIEEVVMIGYPQGLIDDYNNLPILRRGITATSLKIDYNNEPMFLIDCPVFKGSSGSPIFILNEGGYTEGGSIIVGKSRIYFLGVNRAVTEYEVEGDLLNDENIRIKGKVQTKIPSNLGVIIKSHKLLEFS